MKTKYKNTAKKILSLMEIEKPPKSLHLFFIYLFNFPFLQNFTNIKEATWYSKT
jgi:hypothetical protein